MELSALPATIPRPCNSWMARLASSGDTTRRESAQPKPGSTAPDTPASPASLGTNHPGAAGRLHPFAGLARPAKSNEPWSVLQGPSLRFSQFVLLSICANCSSHTQAADRNRRRRSGISIADSEGCTLGPDHCRGKGERERAGRVGRNTAANAGHEVARVALDTEHIRGAFGEKSAADFHRGRASVLEGDDSGAGAADRRAREAQRGGRHLHGGCFSADQQSLLVLRVGTVINLGDV